jgi:Domain of unknown function (DUF4331)
MNIKNIARWSILAVGLLGAMGITATSLRASDHDDGEVDTKGRNLNLTDLYVFREKDQNPNAADTDLVFVMNTNPRSLARQQYYFSNNARYEFNVTRVANNDETPTGKADVVLRFEFSPPNGDRQQAIKVTAIRDGRAISSRETLSTTPLNSDPNTAPVVNQVSLGDTNLAVFAGLREDPFFFDVEQFFRVRAGLLNIGPQVGFRSPDKAVDFATGYNVNAIAVRVPIKFLQGNTSAKTFDVWQTISVPGISIPGKIGKIASIGGFQQFERLARPAINEGLIVTNDFLNAFNQIPPSADLSKAADPVRAEAVRTLKALGNNDDRVAALAGAFLPDVMRIDTAKPSGYKADPNSVNAKLSPITGRMLKDDVVDTTLQVLTNDPQATDNVSYEGAPGNPSQGHAPLVADFPYLALPN